MRYLGVDYGKKRIGIALSDEEGVIAFPRETLVIEDGADLVNMLCTIAKREQVKTVVIGLPPEVPGMDASIRREVYDLAESVRTRCDLFIELENEILSTKIARQYSTVNTDASAAALILQSFLDRKRIV